jgi:type IV pilus assembly protein PilN
MKSAGTRQVNLASQPFRAERAQTALLAAVCAVLTVSLIVLGGLILHERSEAVGLRRQLDAASTELRKLQSEQARFSGVLSKPANADVFATSVFLNEVIARRGLSWTRVFKDLATVMPQNMRLLGVRLPQTAADEGAGTNRVQLDMQVGTTQQDAVIGLLKSLEKSSLFGAATLVNQSPPTQNDPLYKYRVTVSYAQKL